jgi:hypothetical protein
MSNRATPRLSPEANSDTAMPTPTSLSGCGSSRRSTADTPIVTAATKISPPSTPAER